MRKAFTTTAITIGFLLVLTSLASASTYKAPYSTNSYTVTVNLDKNIYYDGQYIRPTGHTAYSGCSNQVWETDIRWKAYGAVPYSRYVHVRGGSWGINDATIDFSGTYQRAPMTAGKHNAIFNGYVITDGRTPWDPFKLYEPYTAAITNEPPTAPSVSLTPAEPMPSDDLVCRIDSPSTDPDRDSFAYDITWYKDGVLQSDLSLLRASSSRRTHTISYEHTSPLETWQCRVLARDSNGARGPQAKSNKVTIKELEIMPGVSCTNFTDWVTADIKHMPCSPETLSDNDPPSTTCIRDSNGDGYYDHQCKEDTMEVIKVPTVKDYNIIL
jgi:hypothetical protein